MAENTDTQVHAQIRLEAIRDLRACGAFVDYFSPRFSEVVAEMQADLLDPAKVPDVDLAAHRRAINRVAKALDFVASDERAARGLLGG